MQPIFASTDQADVTIGEDVDKLGTTLWGSGISSAHFLRMIEDLGTVGLWACNLETGVCSPCPGFYRILGLLPSTSFHISELAHHIHPEERNLAESIWPMIATGVPVNREFRIIRSDRTVRWIEFRSEIVLDDDQRAAHAIGLIMDVTTQHEGKQALEDSLERYRSLVNSLATMEWRASADGVPTFSHGWTALTGQRELEMTSGRWIDAIHPDDRQRVAMAWQTSVTTLAPYLISHRIQNINGDYEWFHVRCVPVIKKGGRSHEWLGIIMRHDDLRLPGAAKMQDDHILTPPQIRAARAMLQWTLDDLSKLSGVSVSSIRRIEAEGDRATRPASLNAIRKAFEDHGLSFTDGNTVCLAKVDKQKKS